LMTASDIATLVHVCLIDDLRAMQQLYPQVRTHLLELLEARAGSEVDVWLHYRCHARSDAGYF
jgi:hypothetical protein